MILWLAPAFAALLALLVVLDLGVLTRRPRIIKPVEAFATYALWLVAAALFSGFIHHVYQHNFLELETELASQITLGPRENLDGRAALLQFITAYVLEVSLSLDNIAVLALLIAYFKVPREVLGRVLFWSLLSTLLIRLAAIFSCAWFVREWPWFKWVLGGVLVVAMIRMLVQPDESTEFNTRWYVRWVRRLIPFTAHYDGQRLFTKAQGKAAATPILLIVLIGSLLDTVFAADSIPALFSVTKDPMIAFTASAMAVLGLRSLYLTLSHVIPRLRYLRISVVFVLLYVAGKMFLDQYRDLSTMISLGVVSGVMLAGVGASALHNYLVRKRNPLPTATAEPRREELVEIRPAPLEDLGEAVDTARRNLRKVIVLIVGTTIVVVLAPTVGIIPGPGGFIVAAFGLGILASEFVWARKLLTEVQTKFQRMADSASQTWIGWVPISIVAFSAGVAALIYYAPYQFHLFREITIKWDLIATIFVGPAALLGYWAWRTTRAWLKARRARRET